MQVGDQTGLHCLKNPFSKAGKKKVLDFYPQMITKTQKALEERLRMTHTEVYVY